MTNKHIIERLRALADEARRLSEEIESAGVVEITASGAEDPLIAAGCPVGWGEVDPRAEWVAQDEGGSWWAYGERPHPNVGEWRLAGSYDEVCDCLGSSPPPKDFTTMLFRRP